MSSSEVVASGGAKRRTRVPVAVLVLALGLWIVLLSWAGVRCFWWWRLGVGVTESPGVEAVWRLHYQELYTTGAVDVALSPDDGYYDVLLLGGSVLEQTATTLEKSLHQELNDRVRLFNLARAAHTSRDTYFKHQRLGGKPFDLVVVYDAINDVRLNCCRDDVYRDDYRHFSWYDSLETRLAAGTVSVSDILRSRLNRGRLTFEIAEGRGYSDHVKTAKAYRQNLEPIAEEADHGHSRVLMMTFAYCLPKNYSYEAFRDHKLGYGPGRYELAAEVWGTREGVEAAILAHNVELRNIARRHKSVILIDEEKQMPPSGTYFSDPCHLTDQGILKFTADAMRVIHIDIERWKASQNLVAKAEK